MNFPKSTPDLNNINPRRSSRRDSRNVRNAKELREFEFKIYNPLKDGNEENFLPAQVKDMDFISTKSIKNIEIPQNRRTSNFEKNLLAMQELARKQELKFNGMLNENKECQVKKSVCWEVNATPINFIEDDQISLELNGFYEEKERIEDDFNIFDMTNEQMIEEEDPIVYYSKQELEPSYCMDEEMDNYLI